MDRKTLAAYLDFANHHQNATVEDIKNLCQKVLEYGFHSAFVNPCYLPLAKSIVGDKAAVGTVVSFPLGQESLEIKIASSLWAVKNGADELDVSMNVGLFKQEMKKFKINNLDHDRDKNVRVEDCFQDTQKEMKTMVEEVKRVNQSAIIKFIIESGYLTDEEIKKASELVLESGADFVKTCSGMGPRGATIHDVELIKSVVADKIKIKVAGGITSYDQAVNFINAGASRLGTSHAVEIVTNTSVSERAGE